MRSILIFFSLALCFAESSLPKKIKSTSDPMIKSAIQEAIRTPATHDITVIANDAWKDERSQNVIDIILNTAIEFGPTQYITSRELNYSAIQHWQLATSRTLIIYITGETTTRRAKNTMKSDILAMSHVKDLPKLLLILITEAITDWKFDLQVIWEHWKMIDVTVLGVTGNRVSNKELSVTVHQLNPFNDEYREQSFNMNEIDWFPDKTKNMHGYPFILRVSGLYGFCFHLDDENGKIYELQGLGKEVIRTLNEAMNFSLSFKYENDLEKDSDMDYCVVELLAETNAAAEHTVPIIFFGYHLMMPVIPIELFSLTLWKMLLTVFVGVFIVAIFWIVSAVLNVEGIFSDPFNVVSVILGLSVERMPNRLAGKILFLCLVAASTCYTCMFYVELFEMATREREELEITNFDDLAASGLITAVPDEYITSLMTDEDIPTDLRKRIWNTSFASTQPEFSSILENPKYAIFFLDFYTEFYVSIRNTASHRRVMKTVDFYIHRLQYSYKLSNRSPYKNRINDLLLRMREGGFIMNGRRDQDIFTTLDDKQFESVEDALAPPEVFVTRILLCVYLLSLIAFAGEVILGYIKSRK